MTRRLLPALLWLAGAAQAEPLVDDTSWKGRADLGYFSQSGTNGSRDRITAKGELNRQDDDHLFENRVEMVRVTDRNVGNTERYLGVSKQRWNQGSGRYLFLREQLEHDSVSAARFQALMTGGLGQALIEDEGQTLTADLGVGARYTRFRADGDEVAPVVTGNLDYLYKFNETTRVQQRVGLEQGQAVQVLRSLSEVRFQLSQAVGFGVGYDLKREYGERSTRLGIVTINLSYAF